MIFEKIPTVPTSEELLDKAYRRAARARKGKTLRSEKEKYDAEESMILTAGNIFSDNLKHVVRNFPSFDNIPAFYRELADILVGVEDLKMSLSSVDWANRKIFEVSRHYIGRIRSSDDPIGVRKSAFGRMSSIINEIDKDLRFLNEARNKLRILPDIRDEPTIVVAGYPNVGKSSFVAKVSSAKPEIAPYPFTTKGLAVGHFTKDDVRYQVIDTPGLLDRPLGERNRIELQAISALKHVAGVVVFITDPTETCGYLVTEQEHLYEEIKQMFPAPIIKVENKSDLIADVKEKLMDAGENTATMKISTLTGDGIPEVLERLIELMPQRKDSQVVLMER